MMVERVDGFDLRKTFLQLRVNWRGSMQSDQRVMLRPTAADIDAFIDRIIAVRHRCNLEQRCAAHAAI